MKKIEVHGTGNVSASYWTPKAKDADKNGSVSFFACLADFGGEGKTVKSDKAAIIYVKMNGTAEDAKKDFDEVDTPADLVSKGWKKRIVSAGPICNAMEVVTKEEQDAYFLNPYAVEVTVTGSTPDKNTEVIVEGWVGIVLPVTTSNGNPIKIADLTWEVENI